jgi:hypothetical protein
MLFHSNWPKFFFFFGDIGGTQDLMLARQVLYHSSHSASIFTIAGMIGMYHHVQLFLLRWGLANFFLPQTVILPSSASQVARITGMSHQHLACV